MSVLTKNFLTVESTASTPRSNWNAEVTALVAEALRLNAGSPQSTRPRLRMRVHGESMLPALWPGDVVEIASCSIEELQPDEIVLAVREDRLFLHRLVSPCTPKGFRLRGDSMPGSDPQYPREALMGKFVRAVDQDRRFSSPALSRALGMLFCHCGPVRRLALRLHGRRKASAAALRNLESAS